MSKEIVPVERIAQRILYLRGQKVLLDRDLAALYGVETRALNQAVKRNADRFPGDFAFLLSRQEIGRISQTVISQRGLKFSQRARAFTEQGVAMLSSVLNSGRAVKVNIAIMRAFVKLRQTLETNRHLAQKFADLEDRVGKHDKEVNSTIEAIRQLMARRRNRNARSAFTFASKCRDTEHGNSYEIHTHWFCSSNISMQWDDVSRPIQRGDVVIAK